MKSIKNTLNYIKNNYNFILFMLATSFFLTIAINNSNDTDIMWHYKLGEEIIQNKSVSIHDTFSWQSGLIWIQHEWLYDALLYLIITLTGFTGYILIYTMNNFLLMIFTIKSNPKVNRIIFIIVFALAQFLIPRNRGNRPSEFSIWFLIVIYNIYINTAKDFKSKYVKLFLIGIFIANFHGGSLITLVSELLVLTFIDFILDIIMDKYFSVVKTIKSLGMLISFMLGTFINPAGIKMINTMFKVSTLETTKYISEWNPLQMDIYTSLFLSLILVTMGYGLRKSNLERETTRRIGITCAFLVLGFTSIKALLLFEFLWFILCYKFFDAFITDFFKKQFNLLDTKLSKHKKLKNVLNILASTTAIFLLFGSIISTNYNLTFNEYFNRNAPNKIISFLKENNGSKVCTSYLDGNILVFNDIKCFVDSRQMPFVKELSSNTSLDDLLKMYSTKDENEVKQFINKYEFEYIWTNSDLNLEWYLKHDDRYIIKIAETVNNKEHKLWERKHEDS